MDSFESSDPVTVQFNVSADNGGQYNGDPESAMHTLGLQNIATSIKSVFQEPSCKPTSRAHMFDASVITSGSRNRSSSEPPITGFNMWGSNEPMVRKPERNLYSFLDQKSVSTIHEEISRRDADDTCDGSVTQKMNGFSISLSDDTTDDVSSSPTAPDWNSIESQVATYRNNDTLSGIQSTFTRTLFSPLSGISSSPLLGGDLRWSDNRQCSYGRGYNSPIEEQAKAHRSAAARSEPRYTWSGQLPVRVHKNPVYSPKVFLGGMPYDISEPQIVETFREHGSISVQWPAKTSSDRGASPARAGYVYVIFEHDRNVKSLLSKCFTDYNGKIYYTFNGGVNSRKKDVQVIPWVIADSNYIRTPSQRLDNSKTVFVGALHGMLTAEGLAMIMNDLFGNVAYVGIDTDKYKYPMGSARVTFSSQKSYVKAVHACFIDIRSQRFNKKIQVDPYIDSGNCSSCNLKHGPIFCRDASCFRYFCAACWEWTHSTPDLSDHRPLMRARRSDGH